MAELHLLPPPIRWRKGELIGAGAFGCVYMGMNLDSGELLAVKQVLIAAKSVANEKAQAHVRELEEEVKLLRNLSHPNIVRYLGTAREGDALNIFLEFVPGGSIASLLGKFGSFPEPVVRMYTRQLLQGLEYLHKNGIMHRDVKGANILVDNKGCIKLADFGASKKVVELVTLSGAKSMKGTPYWMAPEVIRQTGHSLPADIWSVGCTVIEMATGKPPWSQQFQEVAALFHIGTTKSHPPIPEHLSNEGNDFLLKCLKKEPNLRPTATDLLQHPFVKHKYSENGTGLKHPASVSTSIQAQVSYGVKTVQARESSKRRQLSPNPLEESSVKHSSAFYRKSLLPNGNSIKISESVFEEEHNKGSCEIDLNCSVRLDSVQLDGFMMKSFNPMFEPSSLNNPPVLEQSSFNRMTEPTSFDPIGGSTYGGEDGWYNHAQARVVMNEDAETISPASTKQYTGIEEINFSFQCAPADDDDEVTESKIKAFLDEKALELKRLQSPLYMEFQKSIWNVAQQNREANSLKNAGQHKGGTDSFIAPLSPAAGRQLTTTNSRSPSKGSVLSGPSLAFSSRDSEASVSSGSPGGGNPSVDLNPHVELSSPRLHVWKGLLQEAQQLPSPSAFNSTEQQRLWREELQKELDMVREEKKMLSRLASSNKSSPSKSSSPNDKATQRHTSFNNAKSIKL